MPRPEKVQAVEKIREQFDESPATFVTEYRGLTVAEQQQLRRDVRQAQGEYRVLKMSLARRAVEDMEVEGLNELLAGPTALAFAGNDPVPVAKALKEFASKNENLIIKGGLLAGALLPPEQISRLADIESRDVLLGRIAGGFKSPMSKLAGMLGAKMRDAASMFSQLLEKKETDEPAAEPEAEADEPSVEEAPAADTEEVAETDEAPEAEADEPSVEEAPAAEAEEVTEAEEVPEVEVEETAEAEADEPSVEETPEAEADEPSVEEIPEAEADEPSVEEAPAAEAEEVTEAEEVPEAEVEETAEAQADESPADEPEAAKAGTEEKPKKKAAPKAAAEESAAPAEHTDPEGQEEPAADETAEEE